MVFVNPVVLEHAQNFLNFGTWNVYHQSETGWKILTLDLSLHSPSFFLLHALSLPLPAHLACFLPAT